MDWINIARVIMLSCCFMQLNVHSDVTASDEPIASGEPSDSDEGIASGESAVSDELTFSRVSATTDVPTATAVSRVTGTTTAATAAARQSPVRGIPRASKMVAADNGTWNAWTISYGDCISSCGWGYRKVYVRRTCTGGSNCPGISRNDTEGWCKTGDCAETQWSIWFSRWEPCSVTCGSGSHIKRETRKCNVVGGNGTCPGVSVRTSSLICTAGPCPVNGGWGSWTVHYGECSATCGWGYKSVSASRKCNNPLPQHGGNYCQGSPQQNREDTCKTTECAETGWGNWYSTTGPCSVTCGTGVRTETKIRMCNSPDGTGTCPGASTVTVSTECQEPDCAQPVVEPRQDSTGIVINSVIGVVVFTAFILTAVMIIWRRKASYQWFGVDNPSFV